MKSIFRIYAKTSKGNDNHLLKQLKSFNLNPKYDQHLNSFYFNSTWRTLFDLSFRSLTVEQIYLQVGQNFRIVDQQQIATQLQRLPFKNYIPIQRGLIQNTTLKILTRQSDHLPSQNVLINLITNNLNKQIIKKQYFQQIQSQQSNKFIKIKNQQYERGMIQYRNERKNDMSYFDIKETVERKWWQEDQERQRKIENQVIALENVINGNRNKQPKQIERHSEKQQPQHFSSLALGENQQQHQLMSLNQKLNQLKNYSIDSYLSQQLAYHPHLIFYIRKNKGRFLLKINKDNLYKHGWKNKVNWGPIRESIAASILHQSRILQKEEVKDQQQRNQQMKKELNQKKKIKIWDPMCGSGTFGLVAATILQDIPVRSEVEKQFEWVNWPVYKKQYLADYWAQIERQKRNRKIDYQLILSDKDRQTINYSIDNFRLLLANVHQYQQKLKGTNSVSQKEATDREDIVENNTKLFPSQTPTSQVLELVQNKVGFACGDFEDVIGLLKNKNPKLQAEDNKLTIITNLPYLHARSESKYPLNQLKSIYHRFSEMIESNRNLIENVFIVIDKNINDRRHFLNISSLRWDLIGEYTSGGMEIALYAWTENKLKSQYQQNQLQQNVLSEYEKINGSLASPQYRQIILKKEKSVAKSLIQLRRRLGQIDRKYYNLPKHLTRNAHGWRRVLQKRRKRHLQSAYELFARRRDKLVALKKYARQKLELKMLQRGTVWKNKNFRFLDNSEQKLQMYSEEIKKVFEQKIEQALKKKQELQQRRKLKSGDKIETVKIRNKWNNDEKKLIKQVKNSKGKETMGINKSYLKGKNVHGQRR